MALISRKSLTFQSNLSLSITGKRKRVDSVAPSVPSGKKIRKILKRYVNKENVADYENLVCIIRDARLSDEQLCELLDTANNAISMLTLPLRLFVEALLSIRWLEYSNEATRRSYQKFILNLLSAHNYHIKFALDRLVMTFKTDGPEWPDGIPQADECKKFDQVHYILKNLLKLVPMSKDMLMSSLVNFYPFYKNSAHLQELYIYNLLAILEYAPQFRIEIFNLIFTKLVVLDINAPIDEIIDAERKSRESEQCETSDVEMKDVNEKTKTQHVIGHRLDVSIHQLFTYIVRLTHNQETGQVDWNDTKALYHDMMTVFDKVVLPTFNTRHVQFVMFLLCSFKAVLTEGFVSFLWKKICSPNVPYVYRHYAVTYIASLLARASFVNINLLKNMLQEMSNWIHSYIAANDAVNLDVRAHGSFYSMCQALFYTIIFRHVDLVNTSKNMIFLESLNLTKIVTCHLNPLRLCQKAIVQSFASITRTYQLAYCYSIIEHNSRDIIATMYVDEDVGKLRSIDDVLNSPFPFEPYHLKLSGKQIESIYSSYKGLLDISNDTEDMDDFLVYGSSPGFKCRN